MSMKLRILGLLTVIGACSTGAALAAADPHQRAREMIVPSSVAHAPRPAGAMGRLIEPRDYVDPHSRAEKLLKDDRWPIAASHSEVGAVRVGAGDSDPQRRARSMILGHDD